MATPRVPIARHAKDKVVTAYEAFYSVLVMDQEAAVEEMRIAATIQAALDRGDVGTALAIACNLNHTRANRRALAVRLVTHGLDNLDDIEGIEEHIDPAAIRLVEDVQRSAAA